MGRLTSLPSAVITDDSALGGAVLEKSLRFSEPQGHYLIRTPSSAGNRRTFTISLWAKRSSLNGSAVFGAYISNSDRATLRFASGDVIEFQSAGASVKTNAPFRDTSAWYHIVCAIDTTQGTQSNRGKIYVNGVQQTLQSNNLTQNVETSVNNNSVQVFGTRWVSGAANGNFDGYLAEINLIDGLQLDASHFGYTEFQTGIWRPKGYYGSYNTNGVRLDFSDNSAATAITLGKDRSGQGNDFTPTNLTISAGEGNDSFDITPTKQSFASYETNDSVTDAGSGKSYRQGGYTVYNTGAIHAAGRSSFPVNSGKWYAEFKLATYSSRSGSTPYVGAARVEWMYEDFQTWIGNIGAAMNASGATYRNGNSFSGGGVSYSAGDIISVAIDLDNGKQIWWAKNGTYINSGNPATNTGGHNIDPLSQSGYYVFGTSGWASTSQWEANFGQRPFSYSVPAGFKTLQVDNLPDKTQSITKPQKHFDTVLYSGTGSTNQIQSLEFAPDLVWIKRRDSTNYHIWTDTVRGAGKYLVSNNTDAESDGGSQLINGFFVNGFQVGTENAVNNSSGTYVAWCWKAGGTAVTNNDGNNTSQVSVNAEAGFSILTYTGNGTNNSNITMGHGLGKTPACVIIKNRSSAAEWVTWIRGIGGSSYDNHKNFALNTTATPGQNSSQFRYADSSTITVRDVDSNGNIKVNKNGDNYVAYCWAEIPGYSKFGIYKGNGNTDGKFQFTGFRPALIIYKRISSTDNWGMHDSKRDTKNPVYHFLYPDLTNAEWTSGSQDYCDFFANGFKWRSDASMLNGNNSDYAYMAFAEQPQFTPYDTQPNAR